MLHISCSNAAKDRAVIYHDNHYKTLETVKVDSRFQSWVESREKFCFDVVKYTNVKSILFIRPDSIRDNVMAAAMLPFIKAKYPTAKLYVLCQLHIRELYIIPIVDGIIGFDRIRADTDEQYRNQIIQYLQSLSIDLVLNTLYSRDPLSDFFALHCGAQYAIAFHGDLRNINADDRYQNNAFYTNIIRDRDEHKSEMERHCNFLARLGIDAPPLIPKVLLTNDDENFAEIIFKKNNLDPTKTIAFFMHSKYRYHKTLACICQDKQLAVIAVGFERELELSEESIGVKVVNLVGKITLRQTASLLKHCRLGIGTDTDIACLACAVGTPTVVLLGGGQLGRFFPDSPLMSAVCLPLECYGCNWLCRYQREYCIEDIAPELIIDAIEQTLHGPSKKPRLFVQGKSLWTPNIDMPAWKSFHEYLQLTNVEIILKGDIPEEIRQMWNVVILNEEGEDSFVNGNIEGALASFRKALELHPQTALTFSNMGGALFEIGDREQALRYLSMAVEQYPDDRPAVLNYIELLKNMNLKEEAWQSCVNYLLVHPHDADLTEILSDLRFIPHDKMSSQMQVTSFSNRHKYVCNTDGITCLELARKKFQEGANADAADLYEELIEKNPNHAEFLLGELYEQYQSQTDRSQYGLYVSRFFDFKIHPGDKILDIGFGVGDGLFPFANFFIDLATNENMEHLPVADQEFDFVYCSQVLEFVEDPEKACRELIRIAKRGYIETSTRGKNIWMNLARNSKPRWRAEWIDGSLVFYEYLPEEINGFGSNILMNMHCAPQTLREQAFAALIYLKANLVNNMVYWEKTFSYRVYRQHGTTQE